MDFFEAQARAKQRTTRLVCLFVLAVLGTIAAGYFVAVFLLHQTAGHGSSGRYTTTTAAPPLDLWQPDLLGWIALITVAVVGLASWGKWVSLRAGGSAVAQMLGGRRIEPSTTDFKERQLLNVVEEMAIASSVPMPDVYVLPEEPGINAFAAGLTTDDAVVAVTRGSLEKLSRDELQGVVAHEFSHILNGDMRLNVRLTSILFGILVIALIGRGLLRSLFYARAGRSRDRNGGGALAAMAAVGFALLLIGYIGYLFGRLIQAAVSRQREFLADAAAVQFTRNPTGITGALKKIGGFALGGRLTHNAAAQLNHAFFAQGFRSSFGGLFRTHPPLPTRIRAIDPAFDGKFFEPPIVVDVQHESFRTAGFGPAPAAAPPPLPRRIPVAPARLAASAGQLTPAHVEHAQRLLADLPPALRDAAHDAHLAPAVAYGLLLDPTEAMATRQLALVDQHAGPETRAALDRLRPDLARLARAARLPLLQLTLRSLHDLKGPATERFLTTLDVLIHADAHVTFFEFALRKIVTQHLRRHEAPAAPGHQIFSFEALAGEIELVLSAFAHAAADDEPGAVRAFAHGAAQLKMLEGKLGLLPVAVCSLDRLDAALDRLDHASGPIKQRLLLAASHVVAADGEVRETEFELLRAVAASLGVPLPAAT